MRNDETIARSRRKYHLLVPEMDERQRRQWAAVAAREPGWAASRWWPAPPACLAPRLRPGCGSWINRPRNMRRKRRESSAGWRSEAAGGDRPGIAGGAGVAGRTRLPKRWVVERTFSWLSNYRRLSKHYEYGSETGEATVQMAVIHLMLRRFTKKTSGVGVT
jgi:hypothetical protein